MHLGNARRALMLVSAFEQIIDNFLAEGGFAAGRDALTNLTNAPAAAAVQSGHTACD